MLFFRISQLCNLQNWEKRHYSQYWFPLNIASRFCMPATEVAVVMCISPARHTECQQWRTYDWQCNTCICQTPQCNLHQSVSTVCSTGIWRDNASLRLIKVHRTRRMLQFVFLDLITCAGKQTLKFAWSVSWKLRLCCVGVSHTVCLSCNGALETSPRVTIVVLLIFRNLSESLLNYLTMFNDNLFMAAL